MVRASNESYRRFSLDLIIPTWTQLFTVKNGSYKSGLKCDELCQIYNQSYVSRITLYFDFNNTPNIKCINSLTKDFFLFLSCSSKHNYKIYNFGSTDRIMPTSRCICYIFIQQSRTTIFQYKSSQTIFYYLHLGSINISKVICGFIFTLSQYNLPSKH